MEASVKNMMMVALVATTFGAPALALDPPPLSPTRSIVKLVPGTSPVNAGAFLNVRRIFDLYGHLIQKLPQFGMIEQLIAAGFPDPRTDIDEVGLVSDLDRDVQGLAGVATGNIEFSRILAVAAAFGVEFEKSAYRGVELHTGKVQYRSLQVAGLDENKLVFSVTRAVRSEDHPLARQTIETLAGEREDFGAANQIALPGNYLGNISLKVTRSVRDLLRYLGELGQVLQDATHITLDLTADDASKDAPLLVTFRMNDDGSAEALELQLKKLVEDFERNASPRDREIFRSITFSRAAKVLTLNVTFTYEWMQKVVSGQG